ncbi:MAG: glycosyltransferase family 1 protein [Acidobacteria bacterium]|nr:glycosyltransferase family 1 protein [Acidobacteriota bacterium]
MSRVVLATMGSLGDLHPMLALAIELKKRGHTPVVNTWEGYREKVEGLGLEFMPLRPNVDPTDRELLRKTMDAKTGPEMVIKELIFPNLGEMYEDLAAACEGADLLINGEIVYATASLVEKTGIKWISTTLAPLSMFSCEDPNIYPTAEWLEYVRPMPAFMHRALFSVMRLSLNSWYEPYKAFRRSIGLSEDHEPIFDDKFSKLLNLALFSKAIGRPQTDWHSPTLQTGFCFFDESESGELDPNIAAFLDAGEPPIVFTLGSAAVLDARDFFEESAKAAKMLGKRALLLYGRENEPPKHLDENVAAFQYAPYSQVFSRAACVVHQAGVGTTAQVLRAGVPHLIMPYSHDQPDNAARCRRAGVAEIIGRDHYTANSAAKALTPILTDPKYRENAAALKRIVDAEYGTTTACDAIEDILRK